MWIFCLDYCLTLARTGQRADFNQFTQWADDPDLRLVKIKHESEKWFFSWNTNCKHSDDLFKQRWEQLCFQEVAACLLLLLLCNTCCWVLGVFLLEQKDYTSMIIQPAVISLSTVWLFRLDLTMLYLQSLFKYSKLFQFILVVFSRQLYCNWFKTI